MEDDHTCDMTSIGPNQSRVYLNKDIVPSHTLDHSPFAMQQLATAHMR
jgi:hypothetical protein